MLLSTQDLRGLGVCEGPFRCFRADRQRTRSLSGAIRNLAGVNDTREGKRRRLTIYGKTEADAKTKQEAKRVQIAREGVSVASSTRAAVASYATRWLERRVQEVRPTDLRALAEVQREASRASSSALRAHATFMKMLRDAILDGHHVPQRVLLVEALSKGTNDRDASPVPQAMAMLARAASLPHGSIYATRLLQACAPARSSG